MALIKWDESLSVGIESIDKQHMKLVGMINEFYDNIKDRSSRDVISDLIKNMQEYIAYHFKTEEELFLRFGYPAFGEHKKEHEDFENKVADFKERFNSGKLMVSFEITNFLKSWLKGHIQGTDKKYTDFLKSKGVQ